MTGFPDKPVKLTTVLLAGLAGAAGMDGAIDHYAGSLYAAGTRGKRNEAKAAAFKARQRKKRKRK
jgi:hypothetical protein